jgi:spore maturation protein CgeB
MKLVIFGLTISSSWGNGHATLWRGLCKALIRRGHTITFFERDVHYYAAARDWHLLACCDVVLYPDWEAVASRARRELASADAAIVTSFCPDALVAESEIHAAARPLSVFYDLDTPVTLARLESGDVPPWIGPERLARYDLVLSYTGGRALAELVERLGASRVAALYGHVDPDTHRPVQPVDRYRARLSYLGTYAADRQAVLERLFVAPARARPALRLVIGGAQYPDDFPWAPNIWFVRHLPADEHSAFFSSSALTLNVTRDAMARMGWCPSGRLFEAAACGAPVLSDEWDGLSTFYKPGREILVARGTADALDALDRDDAELARIGRAARERTLAEHTSEHRAAELVRLLEGARAPARRMTQEAVTCGA